MGYFDTVGIITTILLVGLPVNYVTYRIFKKIMGPHLVPNPWSRGNVYVIFYVISWVIYLTIASIFFF